MDNELEAIKQIIEALGTLEIDEKKRVLDYVFNRLGLKSIKSETATHDSNLAEADIKLPQQTEVLGATNTIDIRALKEQKNPRTAIQMTALVAYYLSELAPLDERKPTISSEDITKYFKQADFLLPKGEPIYTLRNARNSGYFDPTPEAGVYKLNPVGYNLVAHNLPGAAVSQSSKKKITKAKSSKSKKSLPKKKK